MNMKEARLNMELAKSSKEIVGATMRDISAVKTIAVLTIALSTFYLFEETTLVLHPFP